MRKVSEVVPHNTGKLKETKGKNHQEVGGEDKSLLFTGVDVRKCD